MCKFLRITNGLEYEDYLKETSYKYVPRNLLVMVQRKINPRVICEYMSREDNSILGYGVGVFLDEEDISKEEYKSKLIDTINELRTQYEGIEYLAVDNLNMDMMELKNIEDACEIKIPKGKHVFRSNILKCIEKICILRNKDISETEVLIVSDDTKITRDTVNELALSAKFISLYTRDRGFGEDLEKEVLNKSGLSLGLTEELDSSFSNFDFLINLNEDIKVDLTKISKDKIIIDASDSNILSRGLNKNIKRIIIDDLFFKNDRVVYSNREGCEFGKLLNTSLKFLLNSKSTDIEKVQIGNKPYNMSEGIEIYKIKSKSDSLFKKID